MSDTQRLLAVASALSQLLRSRAIPHAFHGSILIAILASAPHSDEIYCIVEGNNHHPFRRVRDSVAGSEHFTLSHSPWTNRLHVVCAKPIPPIEIEILPAGEGGPRHLDASTVMMLHGVPFLAISEFIRAKLNVWMIRGEDQDAQDILYALSRYWDRVDINRVPEHDMKNFVARNPSARPAWVALKAKYDM